MITKNHALRGADVYNGKDGDLKQIKPRVIKEFIYFSAFELGSHFLRMMAHFRFSQLDSRSRFNPHMSDEM